MTISKKEKDRINWLVTALRSTLKTMKFPEVITLTERPAIQDTLVELQVLILEALGRARIHFSTQRKEFTQIENMITKRYQNFLEYSYFADGLTHSIGLWIGRVNEAVALIESAQETSKVVSKEKYDEALHKAKSIEEKNRELEELIVNISTKAESVFAFNLPDLQTLANRLSIREVIRKEIKIAIKAFRNKDPKGAIRGLGVAAEQLTEELFIRLFGEAEATKIKIWEKRLMKIHAHKKEKDPNLHIIIADLLLSVKWLRNKSDHPNLYDPTLDDVNLTMVCVFDALKKYENILSS